MNNEYPAWIDDYARMIHKSFANMTPADWGPVNFYDCFDALNGTFIDKLYEATTRLKAKNVPIQQLINCFPSPSSFRAAIIFMLYEYKGSDHTKKEKVREVLEYLLEILRHMFKRDIWAYESNIIHTEEDIARLVKEIPWTDGSPELARAIARLGNSASSMSYALYRDYYVAESQEVYAPYKVSKYFGPGTTLIIKHYPKMRPTQLWPQANKFKHDEIKIYLVYEGVSVVCELIGMHTLYTGDLINGLKKYAIEIDGNFYNDIETIKKETESIGNDVVDFWPVYEGMTKEDLKMKFLEWAAYSFALYFKLAGMDWRPTPEMVVALKSKDVRDRVIIPSFPPYEEFVNDPEWEVYWLKELYGVNKKI